MAKSYRVLALIPAGMENKKSPVDCRTPLYGMPLVAYTIQAAKGCSFVDRIVVSTDEEEIRDIATEWGADVPFMLPATAANEEMGQISEILHAIDYFKRNDDAYDIIVTLSPFYPLRTAEDITGALSVFAKTGSDSVLSLSHLKEHPLHIRTMDSETGLLLPYLKNQSTAKYMDMPPYYHVNGAIFVNYSSDITEKTSLEDNDCGYLMTGDNAFRLETMQDLKYCEFLLGERL